VIAVDYELVAIIGHFNSIYIFNPFELKIVRELEGHEKWVRSVCVERVEKIPFLISYGLDSKILFFSLDQIKLYSKNALHPTYYFIPPNHPGLLKTQCMLNHQQKIYKKHLKQQNVGVSHSESVCNRYNSLSSLLVLTRSSSPCLSGNIPSTSPNLPKLRVYFVTQSIWGCSDGKFPSSSSCDGETRLTADRS
jgi:hypothetical protein